MNYSGDSVEFLLERISALEKDLKREVEERNKTRNNLDKRTKELKCHNLLSQIFSLPNLSERQVFQEILDAIPSSLQYPELTHAYIKVNNKLFQTPGFKSSKHEIKTTVFSGEKEVGEIVVGYPELKNNKVKTAFLPEEKDLLNSIAERIGNYLQKSNIEKIAVENELMYKSFMDASPDSITITDLEGNILFTSPQGPLLFGFSKETEILHHNIFEFIDIMDHQKAKDSIHELFEGVLKGAKEFQGIKADGSRFYMEVNGDFIRDTEGNPSKLIFVTRDITERKKASEKLRHSEERYKSIFSKSQSVMLIIDHDNGKIIDANTAACEYYGWSYDDLLKKSIWQINTLGKKEVIKRLSEAINEKKKHFFFKHRLSNGEIRDVEIFSSPILISGKTYNYEIIHDITDRKKTQIHCL